MAGNKFYKNASGVITEEASLQSSAGSGDAGKIVALDSTGKIDNSMMPTGIGADTKAITASEGLAAGNFVNLWSDAGTLKVRKADASGGAAKQVDGFVLAAVTSGNSATVYFEGTNNQLSTLTLGSRYYLSGTTPGGATATAPSTAAYIIQYLGKAISATEISFEMSNVLVLA